MSVQPVTELVSHPEMSALNAYAYPNIHPMFVTELVSHSEMSALNVAASTNIPYMSVTELVSHPEMSALNAAAESNKPLMSVTELVFQDSIPQFVPSDVNHVSVERVPRHDTTKDSRLLSVIVWASTPETNKTTIRSTRATITCDCDVREISKP